MMYWYDHNVSGWGWFAMSVGMILFWAVVIAAGVALFRSFGRRGEQPPADRSRAGSHPQSPTPEQILAERFARGEIDEDEYQRRLSTLRAGGSSSAL